MAPVLTLTSLADILAAATRLLDNNFKPFQSSQGIYESLAAQLRAGVVKFQTGWFPVDPTNFQVISDGLPVAPADIHVIDPDNGVFTLRITPTKSILVAYYYKRLTDDDINQVAVNALSALEFFDDTSVKQIPKGLYKALFHYIRAEGYTIIATKYAEQVSVSLSGRSEQRQQASVAFRQMAVEEGKLGDAARLAFYQRAGAREAPSAGRAIMALVPWQPYR